MSDSFPSLDTLTAQAAQVVFPHFNEVTAYDLGKRMLDIALAENLAVVVNIRTANRTLFHGATPGSSAMNDNWARRKSNAALLTGKASLQIGVENRAKGRDLAQIGLTLTDYADHGGAVPVVVAGTGMVAVATVSGLPELDDHALVIRAMRDYLSHP